eukprot:2911162-Amphidinium_carterae.3
MVRSYCQETASPFQRFGKPYARYHAYLWFTAQAYECYKRHLHASSFEGNNKGDVSAGPTTAFQNWATEVANSPSLEKRYKTQANTIVDETYIDDRRSVTTKKDYNELKADTEYDLQSGMIRNIYDVERRDCAIGGPNADRVCEGNASVNTAQQIEWASEEPFATECECVKSGL